MFFYSTAALLLAGAATAVPTLVQREHTFDTTPLNLTYSSPVNSSLPNILIFATGGTIAGSSASNTDATQYQAGVIGVEALVVAVPELLNVSNIDGAQIANVGSGDISSDLVLHMSKLANYALCSENAKYDGLVITHGTDTLEETAFAMDITVNCGAPVVVVGAMRPSTAISADGPANLLSAVTVAASPEARDRGAMIVLNDRIGQAWYTIKRNANVLDTFGAPEQGYIGGLLSFKPFFYYPAGQPTFKRTFDVSYVKSMPMVDIIYCSESYDFQFINDAVKNGAKGIVLAGTGAGDIASGSAPYVANATAAGIHVVVSTKINVGAVVPSGGGNTISAGFLNPVKSRIQLQHAIANGLSKEAIRDVFEGYLANYIGN